MRLFKVRSSHGSCQVHCVSGRVMYDNLGDDFGTKPEVFNIWEWCRHHGVPEVPDGADIDVLDLGYICADGRYEPPAEDWREATARFKREDV